MKHLSLLILTNLLTYMEGIFPRNGILLFKSVQQGTMKWIHCSSGSGVNVNIPYLLKVVKKDYFLHVQWFNQLVDYYLVTY